MSEDKKDTGFAFGSIRPDIMYQLIRDRVYEKIKMIDYQAVCFDRDKSASFAVAILNVRKLLGNKVLDFYLKLYLEKNIPKNQPPRPKNKYSFFCKSFI